MKKILRVVAITSTVMVVILGAFLWNMNRLSKQKAAKQEKLLAQERDLLPDSRQKAIDPPRGLCRAGCRSAGPEPHGGGYLPDLPGSAVHAGGRRVCPCVSMGRVTVIPRFVFLQWIFSSLTLHSRLTGICSMASVLTGNCLKCSGVNVSGSPNTIFQIPFAIC